MLHTIQELMDKVSAMHGLAVQAHREKYKSHTNEYDIDKVTHLVEQIQAMAGDIYNDRTPYPSWWQRRRRSEDKFNRIRICLKVQF